MKLEEWCSSNDEIFLTATREREVKNELPVINYVRAAVEWLYCHRLTANVPQSTKHEAFTRIANPHEAPESFLRDLPVRHLQHTTSLQFSFITVYFLWHVHKTAKTSYFLSLLSMAESNTFLPVVVNAIGRRLFICAQTDTRISVPQSISPLRHSTVFILPK